MNIKFCVLTVVCATAFVAAAQPVVKKKIELTPEQRAKAMEQMQKATGGFIIKQGEGRLSVINCQSRIGDELISERIDHFFNATHFNLQIVKGNAFSVDQAPVLRKNDGASSALFIIDDPKMPMSLLSIEDGWGMMNVARFLDGDPTPEQKAERFRKEFVRVAGLTFAGVMPVHKGRLFTPVTDGASLEKYPMKGYGIDVMQAMEKYQRSHGVTPGLKTVYLTACQQGWAPEPTNDYQRAIWKKVHAVPDKPIKIEYDKKKGE